MLVRHKQNKTLSVWALIDDRAGNRSQCLGVADALGIDYNIKEISYGFWATLPNRLLGESFAGLTTESRMGFSPPWPDLVIAAGRRTAPVAKKIRSLAVLDATDCFLAHVMDPGGSRDAFGLLAVPRHDGEVKGSNALIITGAPHQLTKNLLFEASEYWRESLNHLPKPWITLIVGGSTRRRSFTFNMARELAAWASKMALTAGGSLLITTSRRTGDAGETLIKAITAPSKVFRWDENDTNDNPYYAYLGLADAVIVTGDSTSMCSEACGGTKPVYIYAPTALIAPKHGRLHQELFDQGYARPLKAESVYELWEHPPLNAAGDVARAIVERLEI